MSIEFHGDDYSNRHILEIVSFEFDRNRSNIANGVAPVLVSFDNRHVSAPFDVLDRDYDDSIQYLPVDKASFDSLKSMVKNRDFEPNGRRLMLATAQILLKNGFFIKKRRLPVKIHVYNYDEHYDYIRRLFPENLKYIKRLPKSAKIEDNYAIDAQTAGELDKIANILYGISVNKAVLRLFSYFNAFSASGKTCYGLLHKAICKRQKTAKYKPTSEFLNNLLLLSNEYSKAKTAIALKEMVYPYIVSNFSLKRMEFFLLLSQNFGYRIPQKLKTSFQNKINSLINTLKSVLSSYNKLKNGERLEDSLMRIKYNNEPYAVLIDSIADEICATPINDDSERFVYKLSAGGFLLNLIANTPTIIGYKNNNSYLLTVENDDVDALCSRLQPIVKDSAKFALFADNAKKDCYFPLYEQPRYEEYQYYYYQDYGHYEVTAENSICYLNLAELFSQVSDSSYPYEFVKQALIAKLPEIMPCISTAFCDIPKIC